MRFLSVKQFAEQHPVLSEGALRWLLFRDQKFRKQCVRRIGRRILLSEEDVLQFINEQREGTKSPS